MNNPATRDDGPARATHDMGPLFGAHPETQAGREPTIREAVQALVEYVDGAPAWDALAPAIRIVLRDFKAQAKVGIEMEQIIHRITKELEQMEAI